MSDLWRRAEEKLREAIAAGEFDNLPGAGRPQDLRVNPFVDPDDRLAHDMLRAHGYSLPWIEEGKDLVREREALLAALQKAWRLHGDLPTARERNRERDRWQRAVARFTRDAATLNRRIATHNLTVPVAGMRVQRLDVDEVVARVRGAASRLSGESHETIDHHEGDGSKENDRPVGSG